MKISEAVIIMENADKREDIMRKLGVSSALVSSWKNSNRSRIPSFNAAAKIYGWYGIIIYPYNENDLMDRWSDLNIQSN